ncbi:hypothetical protein [Microbacterium paraoxydans]|uniref:hypothetical protein n=1 Tax=Microbacterium paraoxydans TaxID=199592 RepID=UPI003EB976D6
MPDSFLPLWDPNDLKDTIDLVRGVGADAELKPPQRFLRSAARLLVKRLARQVSDDPSEPAVIILDARDRDDELLRAFDFSLEPTLDQAVVSITGRIWLSNEKLAFGHFVTHDRSGADLVDWVVRDLQLGDKPTVFFDPTVDGGELRFYPFGLSDLGQVTPYPVGAIHQVTYADARAVIETVYVNSLVSPQHQIVSTWAKPSKHWAAKNAEEVVQGLIQVALKSTFLFCEVDKEGPVRSGRFDLVLAYIEPVTGARTNYGVLELKALRSRGSTGAAYSTSETKKIVSDGLVQAYQYRDNLSAMWAALCCFDLRMDADDMNDCISEVAQPAVDHQVTVDVWRLFNSSKRYRQHLDEVGATA